MKINELKRMIREEISRLNEYTDDRFVIPMPGRRLNPAFLSKKLGLTKTAHTVADATAELQKHVGEKVFFHLQYFNVRMNGNDPSRPIFQLHQRQYYQGEGKWNVTELIVFSKDDAKDNTPGKYIGTILVDTKTFLAECKVALEILKRSRSRY